MSYWLSPRISTGEAPEKTIPLDDRVFVRFGFLVKPFIPHRELMHIVDASAVTIFFPKKSKKKSLFSLCALDKHD